MVDPLSVDPARLKEAGAQLLGLVFPQSPPPMTVPGSDALSAAINATMPNIESLVSEGLPGVKAALTRTATSMGEAGDTYQMADQSMGEALGKFKFSADDLMSGKALGTVSGQMSQLASSATDKLPPPLQETASQLSAEATKLQPRVEATVPQLVKLAPQAAQAAQLASPLMSTLGSVAGQGGGGAGAAAAPAELASDTKPDPDGSDDDQDSDDGAAPGSHGKGSAPTHSGTAVGARRTGTTV